MLNVGIGQKSIATLREGHFNGVIHSTDHHLFDVCMVWLPTVDVPGIARPQFALIGVSLCGSSSFGPVEPAVGSEFETVGNRVGVLKVEPGEVHHRLAVGNVVPVLVGIEEKVGRVKHPHAILTVGQGGDHVEPVKERFVHVEGAVAVRVLVDGDFVLPDELPVQGFSEGRGWRDLVEDLAEVLVPGEDLETGGIGILDILDHPEPPAFIEVKIEGLPDQRFAEDRFDHQVRADLELSEGLVWGSGIALVVGTEKLSSIIDWEDRTTCVLFGDGAGAAVMSPAADPELGVIDFAHEVDGSGGQALRMPAGGSRLPASHETVDQRLHYVHQDGAAVFKFAVRKTSEISRRILERNQLQPNDIDLFVSHQANRRIIKSAADQLGLPEEKVVINIDRYGNTTGATIPLALADALAAGRLKKGNLVLLASVGAGFTVGAVLLRWAY